MRNTLKPTLVALLLGLLPLTAQEPIIAGASKAPELQIETVNRTTLEITEKTVVQSNQLSTPGGQKANGVRAYRFGLQPQETLRVDITSERGALVLQFLYPVTPNTMTPAIRAANQPPKPFRTSKILIKNPSAEPQEAILLVGGPVNHAYTLKPSYIAP